MAGMRTTLLAMAMSLACASCMHSMGLSPTVSHSGFDDARVVSIDHHGLSDYSNMGLGAQWTSARPDDAILTICAYSTTSISGAEVKVDGERHELPLADSPTQFDRAGGIRLSCRDFLATLELVYRMTKAKAAWVLIHTSGGSMEGFVRSGQEDSKAYYALKRFLYAVASDE